MAKSIGQCLRMKRAEIVSTEECDSISLGTGSCKREARALSVLVRLGSVGIFGRLVHMRGAIFI